MVRDYKRLDGLVTNAAVSSTSQRTEYCRSGQDWDPLSLDLLSL